MIHLADNDAMMTLINRVPGDTVSLIKDGVPVTDSSLFARKSQIARARYTLRTAGHPLYSDASPPDVGLAQAEDMLALHAELPRDEDAVGVVTAEPVAEEIPPPVPPVQFPRAIGLPVSTMFLPSGHADRSHGHSGRSLAGNENFVYQQKS